jgi:hypothetical protein
MSPLLPMPLLGAKGHFGPFPFLQLYLMVSYHHIQTRKILGLPKLIKYFCNVWQRMGVSYCFLVQASEIYYQTPFFSLRLGQPAWAPPVSDCSTWNYFQL